MIYRHTNDCAFFRSSLGENRVEQLARQRLKLKILVKKRTLSFIPCEVAPR